MLCLLICVWAMSVAATESTSYQNVVVMIDASFKHARQEIGAGVVIDETPIRTVIVTALHVVQQPDTGEIASTVEVEFRTLRGESFAGKVNYHYIDQDLDLAVVFVDRIPNSNMPHVLGENRAIIAGGNAASFKATQVQVVGAMQNRRWASGVKTDKVISVDANMLQIASADAQAGGSGGAVFDSLERLVAMPVRMEHGVLFALPMKTILNRLDNWGIETGISVAPTGSASLDLLAAYQTRVSFAVTFAPEAIRPNDYRLLGSYPFRNEVRAIMPSDLRSTRASLDIKYEQLPRIPRTLTLSPPDYAAYIAEWPQTVSADVWINFPDGRKLGPLHTKLDFQSSVEQAARNRGAAAMDYYQIALTALKNARTSNAAETKRNDENLAYFNAEQAKLRQRILDDSDKRNLQDLDQIFNKLTLRCWRPNGGKDPWTCFDPVFPAYFEHVVHWLKLGPTSKDLADVLPPDATSLETRAYMKAIGMAAVRILNENETADGVYVRLEVTSGRSLGPKPLCVRTGSNCW